VIRPVDLGICQGYEYGGDESRVALVLPGAMLAGMPANAFAIWPLTERRWRVVQVWDEFLDRTQNAQQWALDRLDAAYRFAGAPAQPLVIGKSLSSLTAPAVIDRGWPAVWLTPLLFELAVPARPAHALMIGGTEDPAWDVGLAGRHADHVVEVPGADHGLARPDDAAEIARTVGAFVDAL
jgi:hypothetical protein